VNMRDDPRLDEAKAIPIENIAGMLDIPGLKRAGNEVTGPCPVCGGVDRFSISPRKNLFNCRQCGGGDGIKLVELVQGCDFRAALAFLCGEAAAPVSPEEQRRRVRRAEEARQKSEEEARRYREKAIHAAKKIWAEAAGGTLNHVLHYLDRRAIRIDGLPLCLRDIDRHKYYQINGREAVHVHTGPCMVAAIQRPDGRLSAVHQTWLDPAQPNGKARIVAADGRVLDAKKVRGSKKGGAIRLTGALKSDVLVMGEGIETTLSAMVADTYPGAMYWAGIDLGNMSGRMRPVDGRRWSGLPDMTDKEAFYPPPWVKRLIFIQDGDSNPTMTRAKLESGLRRAMALNAGLVAQIVHPGKGVDLNDILMGVADAG